jgi:micrococcal nuclease
MRALRFSLSLLALTVLPAAAEEVPARELSCNGLAAGPVRTAVRIVDGETLGLDDGSELRLIGALAPRAIDVGAEPGGWAAEYRTREELRAFVAGKSVELAFGGDRLDRYGRLQAHAYLLDGGQRRWVQGHLLEQGLARAYVLAGNRACANELLAAERVAREAGRGLWSDAAYQVREASSAAELEAYRATFQIIAGRIARVSTARGTVYLNFDRRWRQGFSAFLRSGDQVVAGAFGQDLRALEGRQIRVRGWIEGRGAPRIDLSTAGLLEVLDELPAATRR